MLARLSLRRQQGEAIRCQLPWSQPDGLCSHPAGFCSRRGADQTEARWSRWRRDATEQGQRRQKLSQLRQQVTSKAVPQLLNFPCEMVLIIALRQN